MPRLTNAQRALLTATARSGEMHARGILDALDAAEPSQAVLDALAALQGTVTALQADVGALAAAPGAKRIALEVGEEDAVEDVVAVASTLDMATVSGEMHTVFAAKVAGVAGDALKVALVGGAGAADAAYDAETKTLRFRYQSGVSKVSDIEALLPVDCPLEITTTSALASPGSEDNVLTAPGDDVEASALSGGVAAFSDANQIRVTGTVEGADGSAIPEVDVLLEVIAPTDAKGTLATVHGTEVVLDNGVSKVHRLWLTTDENGQFTVSVTNDQVESVLFSARADGCPVATATLAFA